MAAVAPHGATDHISGTDLNFGLRPIGTSCDAFGFCTSYSHCQSCATCAAASSAANKGIPLALPRDYYLQSPYVKQDFALPVSAAMCVLLPVACSNSATQTMQALADPDMAL